MQLLLKAETWGSCTLQESTLLDNLLNAPTPHKIPGKRESFRLEYWHVNSKINKIEIRNHFGFHRWHSSSIVSIFWKTKVLPPKARTPKTLETFLVWTWDLQPLRSQTLPNGPTPKAQNLAWLVKTYISNWEDRGLNSSTAHCWTQKTEVILHSFFN